MAGEEEDDPDEVSDEELIRFLVKESNKYETVDDAILECKRLRSM
jgi:hypothetical protein